MRRRASRATAPDSGAAAAGSLTPLVRPLAVCAAAPGDMPAGFSGARRRTSKLFAAASGPGVSAGMTEPVGSGAAAYAPLSESFSTSASSSLFKRIVAAAAALRASQKDHELPESDEELIHILSGDIAEEQLHPALTAARAALRDALDHSSRLAHSLEEYEAMTSARRFLTPFLALTCRACGAKFVPAFSSLDARDDNDGVCQPHDFSRSTCLSRVGTAEPRFKWRLSCCTNITYVGDGSGTPTSWSELVDRPCRHARLGWHAIFAGRRPLFTEVAQQQHSYGYTDIPGGAYGAYMAPLSADTYARDSYASWSRDAADRMPHDDWRHDEGDFTPGACGMRCT